MNALTQIVVLLTNSITFCLFVLYPLPFVVHQSVSRLLNAGIHFYFSDFVFPLSFYTLSKYYPIDKHNNTRPEKIIILTGKNKFIRLGELLGHSLNKNNPNYKPPLKLFLN